MTGGAIVIVSDEEELTRALQETIIEEGYSVQTVGWHERKLGSVLRHRQSAVLLDWTSSTVAAPLISLLRRRWTTMPIIILTPCWCLLEPGARLAADEILEKPLHPRQLKRALAGAISGEPHVPTAA